MPLSLAVFDQICRWAYQTFIKDSNLRKVHFCQHRFPHAEVIQLQSCIVHSGTPCIPACQFKVQSDGALTDLSSSFKKRETSDEYKYTSSSKANWSHQYTQCKIRGDWRVDIQGNSRRKAVVLHISLSHHYYYLRASTSYPTADNSRYKSPDYCRLTFKLPDFKTSIYPIPESRPDCNTFSSYLTTDNSRVNLKALS